MDDGRLLNLQVKEVMRMVRDGNGKERKEGIEGKRRGGGSGCNIREMCIAIRGGTCRFLRIIENARRKGDRGATTV
jgi:hypothetical protein